MKSFELFLENHESPGLFDATVEVMTRAHQQGVRLVFTEDRPHSQHECNDSISALAPKLRGNPDKVRDGLEFLKAEYVKTKGAGIVIKELMVGLAAAYGITINCADVSDDPLLIYSLIMMEIKPLENLSEAELLHAGINHVAANTDALAKLSGIPVDLLTKYIPEARDSVKHGPDAFFTCYDRAFNTRAQNDVHVAQHIFDNTGDNETAYVIYGASHGDLERETSITNSLMKLGAHVVVHRIQPDTGEIQEIFHSIPRPASAPAHTAIARPFTPGDTLR